MPASMAREDAVTSRADPATFEGFYREHRDGLYRALGLTLGDPDLACEAVDEALVRACQRWRRIRGYDNPAGWVYRVALNWAISRLRHRGRSVPVAELDDRPGHGEPVPPDEQLSRAVAGLPAHQRAAIVLRFHLDWTNEQIATALDVPSGTVKSRIHRGLATLREQLEDTR